MKRSLLKLAIGLGFVSLGGAAFAQCPTITCPSDVTIPNDGGTCEAVYNYTEPVGTDPCSATNQTFTYTGAMETFVVPAGINSVTIETWGAQGGNDGTVLGGLGGYATGTLAVTPGQTLYIYVGGKGTDGPGSGQNCGLAGGWNGGGPTGATCCSNAGGGAGAGGGASDVRVGGTALTDRVIVGAGGGGAGDNDVGANGGGLVGDNGGSYNSVQTTGGTQSAGGQAGGTYWPSHTCSPATDGALGVGGDGDGNDGGGGGGGYYGGGGGANNGAGGGGSSYIGGVTAGSTTGGLQSGDGEIVISWSGTGGPVTTTQIAGMPTGSTFPVGTTTNTFVVESQSVTDTCSFTVTVEDTEAPVITCPGNTTMCTDIGEGLAPSIVDNCTGETLSYTLTGATSGSGSGDANGATFFAGTTTVTYDVIDAAGNTDQCSFDVTINTILDLNVTTSGMTLTAAATGVTYQWLVCPSMNALSGQTNQAFTAGSDGSYAVEITDGSCTDTSACISVSQASVEEFGAQFKVYPNPTDGAVTVDLGNYAEDIEVRVVSADGKVVYTSYINSTKQNIDLSTYSKGIYSLIITDGSNQSIHRITLQ